MTWNWQRKEWPEFQWDEAALISLEADFLHKSGVLIGTLKHFNEQEKNLLTLNIMTDEAVKTSEIEGEYLDRESVKSSICKDLGLQADN
jgi:Fic family protein